ncbi:MAG: hypothetical protein EBU05_10400 [Chitinophagia bacterium]|nr:hypothetical protein [Chitinophagia bacterium]
MYYTTNQLNFATQGISRMNLNNSTMSATVPYSADMGTSSGGILHYNLRTTGSVTRPNRTRQMPIELLGVVLREQVSAIAW